MMATAWARVREGVDPSRILTLRKYDSNPGS
jgi:hypothetical protein